MQRNTRELSISEKILEGSTAAIRKKIEAAKNSQKGAQHDASTHLNKDACEAESHQCYHLETLVEGLGILIDCFSLCSDDTNRIHHPSRSFSP